MKKYILKDATIIDGIGTPGFRADVIISGDTIAERGVFAEEDADEIINLSGLCLCPGFVDIHTHSDGMILAYPDAESRVFQGITTEITGNCGMSAAPLFGERAAARKKRWLDEEGVAVDWDDLDSYFSRLESTGIAVNHGILLGHGSLRKNLIGDRNRALASDEMNAMRRTIAEGMEQGAFGVSTGLEYMPGKSTPLDELLQISHVVHEKGGIYTSHIRNEQEGLLEAVSEALLIGRKTGIPVQVSHLKACGRNNWDKQLAAVELIENARDEGLDVMFDVYPYTAYSTELAILLAPWVREGGAQAIVRRLCDRSDRARIRQELTDRIILSPGNAELIVISRVQTAKNQAVTGLNLLQIAEQWSTDPVEVILTLLEEEEASVSFVGHGMSEENVESVLSHPLSMVGSDGFVIAPNGKAACSCPHPRCYGTYPRVLQRYWKERKLFSLEEAVRKMTSMPADRVGIRDRGRIAKGMKADIVIFDAVEIAEQSTFSHPHQYPKGIRHVLVNGQFVIRDGKHTGARAGRVVRKEA